MKTKFNLDDELSLNKTKEIPCMIIVVRVVKKQQILSPIFSDMYLDKNILFHSFCYQSQINNLYLTSASKTMSELVQQHLQQSIIDTSLTLFLCEAFQDRCATKTLNQAIHMAVQSPLQYKFFKNPFWVFQKLLPIYYYFNLGDNS